MRLNSFLTGVAAGVAIGTVATMTGTSLSTNKGRRIVKRRAGRVLHTMGDIVDNLAGTFTD